MESADMEMYKRQVQVMRKWSVAKCQSFLADLRWLKTSMVSKGHADQIAEVEVTIAAATSVYRELLRKECRAAPATQNLAQKTAEQLAKQCRSEKKMAATVKAPFTTNNVKGYVTRMNEKQNKELAATDEVIPPTIGDWVGSQTESSLVKVNACVGMSQPVATNVDGNEIDEYEETWFPAAALGHYRTKSCEEGRHKPMKAGGNAGIMLDQMFKDPSHSDKTGYVSMAAKLKRVSEDTAAGAMQLQELAADGEAQYPAIYVNHCVTQWKSKFDIVRGCRQPMPDGDLRAIVVMTEDADSTQGNKWPSMAATLKKVSEDTATGIIRLKEMAGEGELLFPASDVNDCVTKWKTKMDNVNGRDHSLPDGIVRAADELSKDVDSVQADNTRYMRMTITTVSEKTTTRTMRGKGMAAKGELLFPTAFDNLATNRKLRWHELEDSE